MSLFELIGELINPGPTGKIDLRDTNQTHREKLIPIRFVISLIILVLIEYLLLRQPKHYNAPGYILRANAVLLVYLLISARIRVRPDTRNLGWVPFLINNPFRISDDINRFLFIINVLFMPGKYIAKNVSSFYRYLKAKQARSVR